MLLNIVKKETIYLGPWIGRQTIIITTQKRSMLILSRAARDLNGIFNNFQEDTSAFGTSGFRVSKIFKNVIDLGKSRGNFNNYLINSVLLCRPGSKKVTR